MLRKKLGTTVQTGLRIREELRRKLGTAAKKSRVSFNEELTRRLEDSFQREPIESLLSKLDRNLAEQEATGANLARDARWLKKYSTELLMAYEGLLLVAGHTKEVQDLVQTSKARLQAIAAEVTEPSPTSTPAPNSGELDVSPLVTNEQV